MESDTLRSMYCIDNVVVSAWVFPIFSSLLISQHPFAMVDGCISKVALNLTHWMLAKLSNINLDVDDDNYRNE